MDIIWGIFLLGYIAWQIISAILRVFIRYMPRQNKSVFPIHKPSTLASNKVDMSNSTDGKMSASYVSEKQTHEESVNHNKILNIGGIDTYENLLTSQLVACHIQKKDNTYKAEYYRRLHICGLQRDDIIQAIFDYEAGIIRAQGRIEMLANKDYIYAWFFSLSEPAFDKPISEYVGKNYFSPSEAIKLFDEADWHFANSHEKQLSDAVWNEIFLIRSKAEILLDVTNKITQIGLSKEQAQNLLRNDQTLLYIHKWKKGRNERNPYD